MEYRGDRSVRFNRFQDILQDQNLSNPCASYQTNLTIKCIPISISFVVHRVSRLCLSRFIASVLWYKQDIHTVHCNEQGRHKEHGSKTPLILILALVLPTVPPLYLTLPCIFSPCHILSRSRLVRVYVQVPVCLSLSLSPVNQVNSTRLHRHQSVPQDELSELRQFPVRLSGCQPLHHYPSLLSSTTVLYLRSIHISQLYLS